MFNFTCSGQAEQQAPEFTRNERKGNKKYTHSKQTNKQTTLPSPPPPQKNNQHTQSSKQNQKKTPHTKITTIYKG